MGAHAWPEWSRLDFRAAAELPAGAGGGRFRLVVRQNLRDRHASKQNSAIWTFGSDTEPDEPDDDDDGDVPCAGFNGSLEKMPLAIRCAVCGGSGKVVARMTVMEDGDDDDDEDDNKASAPEANGGAEEALASYDRLAAALH